jgi:hypothetical protein
MSFKHAFTSYCQVNIRASNPHPLKTLMMETEMFAPYSKPVPSGILPKVEVMH